MRLDVEGIRWLCLLGLGTPGLIACSDHSSGVAAVGTASRGQPHVLMVKWCGDCHAPPDPSVHKPDRWPGVVLRMDRHRVSKGLGKIAEPERQELIEYLQSHAQP